MSVGSLFGDVLWSVAVLYAASFIELGLKKKKGMQILITTPYVLKERGNQIY